MFTLAEHFLVVLTSCESRNSIVSWDLSVTSAAWLIVLVWLSALLVNLVLVNHLFLWKLFGALLHLLALEHGCVVALLVD